MVVTFADDELYCSAFVVAATVAYATRTWWWDRPDAAAGAETQHGVVSSPVFARCAHHGMNQAPTPFQPPPQRRVVPGGGGEADGWCAPLGFPPYLLT